MAITTRIVVQQAVTVDQDNIIVGKYPRYIINMGTSISSITATELAIAVDQAQTAATGAKESEINSKASELASKASELAAKASEDAAKISETNAGNSEDAAKISEDNSKASELASKASEVASKDSEVAAKASEDAAKISEDNSKESELASKASELASKASEDAAKISEDNSKASELASKASEVAAKDSEVAAKASELASKASELASKASEDAAKISEDNAAESKRLAELARQGAETAEANAEASEIASKTSEDNSKASEDNAKISETNAKISETNAGNSETSAETDAARAEAAADRAEAVLDSKLDKEDISAFFKGYQTKAQADADVASRVPGEKILVWNQDGPKYSWYTVKDTAGVLSLELESDEQKMVSVNNIRPDSLGNVQVTIPGGNPSLWLGEVTWFPYDKDNTIGYSGILLADGREVRRVDYPDGWIAIETGLIPSVTEAEWQAGQNMYFSTGDGSTTFRLPNLLQGQAFRAASIGEEDTSKIQEQIPFITTVNGVGPVDATGAVVIGITNMEGILPVSQGGTGTTTVNDARKVFRVQGVECSEEAGPDNYNVFRSPTGSRELRIRNEHGWGVYEAVSGNPVPLSITEGGTGAVNASGARQNIELERYNQSANETYIQSPDKLKYLTINNDKWGFWNAITQSFIPLGIEQGGTGAKTVADARNNLNLGTGQAVEFAEVNSNRWNDITSTNGGIYHSTLYSTTGTPRSQSRLYNSIDGTTGEVQTVIHTKNLSNNVESYCNFNNSGLLTINSLGVTGKSQTATLVVNDKMAVGTPGGDNTLGVRSITIGDNDSGFRWSSDGVIQAVSDGANIFAFTPSNLTLYKEIQSYADSTNAGLFVKGQRTGNSACLVGGQIQSGAFSDWRSRATGILCEIPAHDSAISVFKTVQWGSEWVTGMDCINWSNGGAETHLYVKSGDFIFNHAGSATCNQWVSLSDIRMKTQLKEIVSAKEKVKALQGYTYFKRNNLHEDEHSFYSEEAGLIAQDVATVLPEAVYKISDTDYLGISYAGVTALLVEAIKELLGEGENLRAATQELTKTVSNQEEELKSLRSELDELKALVASLIKQ